MIVCFLVALCGHALAAPTAAPAGSECEGNGARVTRGKAVFECQNGKLVAKACLFNGQEQQIGGQFQDDKNFYTCQQSEDGPKSTVLGCIADGQQVKLDAEVIKADFVMVCNATVNNGARLMPSKCIKNGQQYSEGQSFLVDNYRFKCIRVGRERLAVKADGCNYQGKELKDGDRYTENGVSKECRIDNGQASTQVVGCIQTDETGAAVDRRMGCTWTEGKAPQQYEMRCEADEANKSAKKVMVRCNYQVNGGVHTIEPRCFRSVEDTFIACQQADANTLKYQTFKTEAEATSAGFHKC